MQILLRVINTFHVDLSVQALLEAPTVAEMARCIVAHESVPGRAEKIDRTPEAVQQLSDDEVGEALRQKIGEIQHVVEQQ